MIRTGVALIACVLATACSLRADDELSKLIDDLVKISEPSVGYSAMFSGSTFLPYADSEQLNTLIIGGTYRSESDVLRRIVAKGSDAVPTLLKHLSDDRKIAIEPLSGMMWMGFPDEYDFNARTRATRPRDVNRDWFGSGEKHPDSHAITVGDLCFVAIGQIVNRNFSATRYQPTGGLIINSPTYSTRLRKVVSEEWADFTREKHRRLLTEDFEKPDDDVRRIGAYWRLSFYYPDAVEPLVLKALEQPVLDVRKIDKFCLNTLYPAKPEDRKRHYDEFIRANGNHYANGVINQLFDDLNTLEAHEEHPRFPPLGAFSTQPRELLIQLFGYSGSVKSSDCPTMTVMSEPDRARFIGSLTHDPSKQIGEVVKQLFLQHMKDDYLAPACLRCLANRGADEFLVAQLNRIDYSTLKVNVLHSEYLRAIATSESEIVRERLLQVLRETNNDTYFVHALAGLDHVDDVLVWEHATRILKGLPDDTKGGEEILKMIAQRFPDKAEECFKSFLAAGSRERAQTMCEVLWYGHPLAPKVLAPLLDDTRELDGFAVRMRVCDYAAQAIGNAKDDK